MDSPDVAVENRADEIVVGTADEDDSDDSDIEASIARKHQVTRSGRASRPYDYKRQFPGIAHVQRGIQDGKHMRP